MFIFYKHGTIGDSIDLQFGDFLTLMHIFVYLIHLFIHCSVNDLSRCLIECYRILLYDVKLC